MTTFEQHTGPIHYPYQAYGLRRFAISLGLTLVAWGRNRSTHRPSAPYRQQVERLEASRAKALQLGGIR